ncbi:MAG: FAD-dependent monooxygenase, partial [Opitutales bacterium]|nr:FAD-dependent monooxygenase [Opitutales bacterium]
MTTHDKVDAIIVGAGAGGGCVAKQLATAGLKCVLLERGGWHDYEESTNDELINQRTHAIRSLHGPDVAKHGAIGQKSWIPLGADIAACVGSG